MGGGGGWGCYTTQHNTTRSDRPPKKPVNLLLKDLEIAARNRASGRVQLQEEVLETELSASTRFFSASLSSSRGEAPCMGGDGTRVVVAAALYAG